MIKSFYLGVLLSTGLLLSFFAKSPIEKLPKKKVLAHWSQIIGNTQDVKDKLPLQIVGRFVINNKEHCKNFILEAVSVEESSKPIVPTSRNLEGNDSNFKIKLCQFEMDSNWKQARLLKKEGTTVLATFPGPYSVGRQHRDSLQIVGIGDTGCRKKNCDGEKNKSFRQVVKDIIEKTPNADFAVHVGDYRYYKGDDFLDAWAEWELEFFEPAQPLLSKMPMIFTRGNHEQCRGGKKPKPDQYGQRWYQFFEPTTSATIQSCKAETASIGEPWYVDVAVKNTSDGKLGKQQRLVMIDNSPDQTHYEDAYYQQEILPTMTKNFKKAIGWSDGYATWWVMHKPLWYYPKKGKDEKPNKNKETKLSLFKALADMNRLEQGICDNEPCNIDAILSGHLHMYQFVDFPKRHWPNQYVLGHGGVDMKVKPNKNGVLENKSLGFVIPTAQTGQPEVGPYHADIELIYKKSGFLVWTFASPKSGNSTDWSAINCLEGEANCRQIK